MSREAPGASRSAGRRLAAFLHALFDAVEWFASDPLRLGVAVLVVLYLSVLPSLRVESHEDTHIHLHQARAFLQGELALDRQVVDSAEVDGRFYGVFPPFPALLLVPFVWVFGSGFKVLSLTPILGAGIALAGHRLARRVGGDPAVAGWAALGLTLGTTVWLCARHATDTYLSHLCAVLLILLALVEAFGRRRGLLIGFALGFAFLSRQLVVLAVPFVLAALLAAPVGDVGGHRGRGRPPLRWRSAAAALVGPLVCVGFYFWLNQARFGDPFVTGYAFLDEEGWYGLRLERWGNFSWVYVPSNLLRMFAQGFHLEFEPPAFLLPRMSPAGTSLTFASPFLFAALAGRLEPRWLHRLGWATVGGIAAAILAHKSSLGGWQINGMRYTLDFVPVVYAFLVLGLVRIRETCWEPVVKVFILYAVALNAFALSGVPLLRRVLAGLPH